MILFTAKNSGMGAVTWVSTPSRSTMTHTSGWPLAARTWSTNLRGCINISRETDPFSLQLKLAVCGTPPMVVVGALCIQTGSTLELANEKNAGMASKVASEPPSPERE